LGHLDMQRTEHNAFVLHVVPRGYVIANTPDVMLIHQHHL